MRGRPKLWLPLLILAGAAVCVAVIVALRPRPELQRKQPPAPLVRVQIVTPEPVQFVVRAHGSVVPRSQSELSAQVEGEIVWVAPSLVAGGFLGRGNPLFRIDRSDYEVGVEATRAAVARSRSEHARARKERDRQRSLAERSVVSQARIDDVENAYRIAEARLREARARLSRAERDLARSEIRAPYAGRVREENVDVGQFVKSGDSLARIYAVDYAEVRLPVPDRELSYIDVPLDYRPTREPEQDPELAPVLHRGPAVRLRAEFAGRMHEWSGRVVRTEGELDPKSRMIQLVARVEDPYRRGAQDSGAPLAVGMFVEAEIEGRRIEGAVRLPRSAVRAGPEGDAVLVLDEEQRLRFRAVEVLRRERESVVIGRGLRAGERVCVSSLRAPVDGMRVRLAAPTADAEHAARGRVDAPERALP